MEFFGVLWCKTFVPLLYPFQVQFLKSYTNAAEELKRREIWEKNIAHIDRHNEEFKEGKHSYTLAENKYADMV